MQIYFYGTVWYIFMVYFDFKAQIYGCVGPTRVLMICEDRKMSTTISLRKNQDIKIVYIAIGSPIQMFPSIDLV